MVRTRRLPFGPVLVRPSSWESSSLSCVIDSRPYGATMAGPAGSASPFHFGVFELDLRAGELRKRGIRIKIQEQPLQILGLLIDCPGEVITREQIQKKLWDGDPFVDFDNAINSAIRQMRDALGDTSENPRFVETVARRGYRFIAPVTQHHNSASRVPENQLAHPEPSPPSLTRPALPDI